MSVSAPMWRSSHINAECCLMLRSQHQKISCCAKRKFCLLNNFGFLRMFTMHKEHRWRMQKRSVVFPFTHFIQWNIKIQSISNISFDHFLFKRIFFFFNQLLLLTSIWWCVITALKSSKVNPVKAKKKISIQKKKSQRYIFLGGHYYWRLNKNRRYVDIQVKTQPQKN